MPAEVKVVKRPRTGEVIRLKKCLTCGKWKREGPDKRRSQFPVASRGRYEAHCRECSAARRRARYARLSPEQKAARVAQARARLRADPELAATARLQNRERQRRYRQDPVQRERERLRHVRWYERKMRDDPGFFSVARMAERKAAAKPKGPIDRRTVPTKQFLGWLEAYMERTGLDSAAALAPQLGVNERRLSAVLSGEQKNMTIEMVDRAIVTAEVTLELGRGKRKRLVSDIEDLYPGVFNGNGRWR